jgi:hypothetical protein
MLTDCLHSATPGLEHHTAVNDTAQQSTAASRSIKAARILLLVLATAFGSALGSMMGVAAIDAVIEATDCGYEPGSDKQRIYISVHYGHPIGTVAGGLCGAIFALVVLKWGPASRPALHALMGRVLP